VQTIRDLKGKRIGVDDWLLSAHLFLALMTAYVGLDPNRDIQWVTSDEGDIEGGSMRLFVDGKIDAFLAAPPRPQLLRARKIGHSLLNTTLDQPWSQYYCCTVVGGAEYVARYPVATKRVLRAVLKAADLCASQPKWAARRLVDRGFDSNYDLVLQTLADIRYDRWRDFEIEDSARFFALRMREVGLIDVNPNQIIASGTDWRFINELKRELRG
jgi:NitT/TauT family transport system substrate-binding protein